MDNQLQKNEWLTPLFLNLVVVGVLSAIALAVFDYTNEFAKLWDFRVYLKAREHYFETGNPYFNSESLRFIYPPSATFVFYLINDSAFFKLFVFAVNGALWITTACLFCRSKVEILVSVPALLLLFGMQGWVAILTGNIACLLYFSAGLSGLLYYKGLISTVSFLALIFVLTLIKPFYAEFLIFVWFMRGTRDFLIVSLAVVAGFFAINILLFPELFDHFLSALKFDDYDTEIYGITAFSHFSSLGFSTLSAVIFHFLIVGLLFVLFILRLLSLNGSQKFACIFILAVFINPKHITYDLMVAVPALIVLLMQARPRVLLTGLVILILASVLDFNPDGKPYFQWWYAFVATFFLVLVDGRFHYEGLFKRAFTPTEAIGVK